MIDLDTITPAELENKLYKLAHECYAADKLYIRASEDFEILDDNKKPYFACVVDEQAGKSTAEKERAALKTPEWGEWLRRYQAARYRAREARVERDNKIRLHDTCQTILWSKNKERGRV
jgi:hypothetical protein